ncbi:hypothetical protein EJ02DRAFT_482516 [Clathrospora elynae]|uniref:BZIP domain-containing protein n=1 Tax=Clathrospora elynae TaxID=706981 RepID=A0A6A5SXY1_9PLEO|nr:hypothetical protein EJ02DRAFT_482516 [Clathrospora elynae]
MELASEQTSHASAVRELKRENARLRNMVETANMRYTKLKADVHEMGNRLKEFVGKEKEKAERKDEAADGEVGIDVEAEKTATKEKGKVTADTVNGDGDVEVGVEKRKARVAGTCSIKRAPWWRIDFSHY